MLYKFFHNKITLFKDINFSLVCISGFLATFANGLVYISASWYAYSLYHSITGVAIMMLLIWLPGIALSPLYGSCADRYNKKHLVMLSLLVRGISICLFGTLFILKIVVSIFYLAIILGVFVAFYMPAIIPLITKIIPQARFVEANATIDMLYEIGTVSGMGISGILIIAFGINGTLLIGGLIFCCAGLVMFYLPFNQESANKQVPQSSSNMRFTHALNYLCRAGDLLGIYVIQILIMTIIMTVPVLLVPYVKEILQGGTDIFAAFEAIYSLGILIGCLFIPVCHKNFGYRKMILVLIFLMASSLMIISFSQVFTMSIIAYFILGISLSSWALTLSESQKMTLIHFQGRLQSLVNAVSGFFVLIAYLLITFKGNLVQVTTMYLIAAILLFCVFFISLIVVKKSQIDNPEAKARKAFVMES
ncbi:MFS transporter [Facilibium subflavum]|uniref:MFS transporter n=1 Tax=Facilibium subflavum TaxID=2219058 RepID=UPI0013C3328E|nr:MFS transporter [Facilibium subflavum]